MLNVIAVRKKFKCADNLSNHINTLTQKVPKMFSKVDELQLPTLFVLLQPPC